MGYFKKQKKEIISLGDLKVSEHSNLGIKFLETQNNLVKNNKPLARFIREYAYDKCHILTKVLSEYLQLNDIAVFYLKNTNVIIHSAILLKNERIIDARGISTIKEILAFYDQANTMTGVYQHSGCCLSKTIKSHEFDPEVFYNEKIITDNKLLIEKYIKFFKKSIIELK